MKGEQVIYQSVLQGARENQCYLHINFDLTLTFQNVTTFSHHSVLYSLYMQQAMRNSLIITDFV